MPFTPPQPPPLQRIGGMEHIHTFAHGESVVAMTEFKGRLIIATSSDIYEIVDRHLVRMHVQYLSPPTVA